MFTTDKQHLMRKLLPNQFIFQELSVNSVASTI